MSRERYNGEVPIGRDGSMQTYPQPWAEGDSWPYRRVEPEMRVLPQFNADMKIVDYERGQSAMRVIVEDMRTGKRYPVFWSDIWSFIEGTEIKGFPWKPVKKGQNYAIQTVQ